MKSLRGTNQFGLAAACVCTAALLLPGRAAEASTTAPRAPVGTLETAEVPGPGSACLNAAKKVGEGAGKGLGSLVLGPARKIAQNVLGNLGEKAGELYGNHVIGPACATAFWDSVAAYGEKVKGYSITARYMRRSVRGGGDITDDPELVAKIKTDNDFLKFLDANVPLDASPGQAWNKADSFAFNSGDLYVAIHNANAKLSGVAPAKSDDEWKVKVNISDTFNFELKKSPAEVQSYAIYIVNNAAYQDQLTGFIKPFNISVDFEMSWTPNP